MADVLVGVGDKQALYIDGSARLYTLGLGACLAVGGIEHQRGALMHIRQTDLLDDFFSWFRENISPQDSRIYVVGGRKGSAEEFVSDVTRRLGAKGYSDISTRVLTDYHIDMWLGKEGVELHYNRELMHPGGELQLIPLHSERL